MFDRLFQPAICNERDRRNYAILVTTCCVGAALFVNVPVHLAFFISWTAAIREWALTFFEAVGLAAPISYSFASALLQLHRAKQTAELASLTDPMTGLMNRRALTERMKSLDGAILALVIADIDHFKRVNDGYGHLAGDRVIEAVGRMMADALAEFGPLARVGGEEFALLADGVAAGSILAAIEAARRLIADTPIIVEGGAVRVTVSAGLATGGPDHGFERLYAEADRALYLAKTSGRNRVLKFEEMGRLEALRRLAERRIPPERASA